MMSMMIGMKMSKKIKRTVPKSRFQYNSMVGVALTMIDILKNSRLVFRAKK
jgi:hypothetical protein